MLVTIQERKNAPKIEADMKKTNKERELVELPLNQILAGDCVDVMNALPNDCIDLIFVISNHSMLFIVKFLLILITVLVISIFMSIYIC